MGHEMRAVLLVLVLSASSAIAGAPPLVFLGDKDLRPYEFLDDGKPRGANVDLAMAVGRELGRPVEVRLMDWDEAQKRLLAGEGSALTLLASTPERQADYAFTQKTVPAAFALFVRGEENHRFIGQSLSRKVIGVTQGGLARTHLQATHPEATYVIVDTVLQGMQKLVRREIDAMAAQEWSAYYLLNELGIRGIVGLAPFLRVDSNMAVRKADVALVSQLDAALQRIKDSGEFDRILDRWSHTRVHLVSERMMTTLGLLGVTVVTIVAVLMASLMWQRRQRVALALEVERRRALEQDLLRSRSSLEEADIRKDQFLATLAHELRNPLAPILHAARVIELRGGDVPEVVKARSVIDRQTRRLSRLVDDLLDVGRIKTGKMELRLEASLLGPVVEEAVESCERVIAAGGHRFECDVPPLWVDCDRVRIAQVLGNLLTNAARYNPAPVHIRIAAQQAGGIVSVTVSDDGVGIRTDALESVFELFYQDAQPAAAGNDGLGIGLWLSRQLVELHGGTLAASSEGVGRGSAFTLTLRAAVPLPAEPDGPHGDHATSALRILVVDDNVDAAQALGMLLELEGNEVALAHNGAEAAERAAEFLPEIIFLDVGLPDIDGLEVCRRLRRSAQGRRTTIVALTGWGSAEDMQRTADAGFDGHLTKPVGPESIDHWLARAQSARTPSRAPAAG